MFEWFREAFDMDEEPTVELDVVPVEEPAEEVAEEDSESLETKVENLEDKIENIEAILMDKPLEGSEEDDFTSSVNPSPSVKELLDEKIRKDFFKYSNCTEDMELTEDYLNRTECQKSYIPGIAGINNVSRQRVIDALLNRQ